jgi:hypothetical protein
VATGAIRRSELVQEAIVRRPAHGRAPEPRVRWWQDHLTPAWKHLSGLDKEKATSRSQYPTHLL